MHNSFIPIVTVQLKQFVQDTHLARSLLASTMSSFSCTSHHLVAVDVILTDRVANRVLD